jgi:hypothetical protein
MLMSDFSMVILLVIAIGGFGWLIYRVVGIAEAGGETAARADINSAGALPGSEQIDSAMSEAKSRATVRHNGSAI